jgi:predicted lysophospholipase L1 biosynthesis ABC-type transport system permease subunit
MGIEVLAGADFAGIRDRNAPLQAVVNETFVRRFGLAGADAALGHRITSGGRDYAIAGVVRDSLYEAYGEAKTPFIYLSIRDRPSAMVEIHVRARGGSEKAVTPELRSVVRELNADLPLYNVRTLTEHVDSNLVFRRIPARMFVVLGPLILVLVAVGIYAVVAYAVSQRRKEIGTRLALGATATRVAAAMVADTLRLVVFGMAGGLVVALMIDPTAFSRLPDVLLLCGVATLFLGTAVLASWLPAYRASQINPIVVLKQD